MLKYNITDDDGTHFELWKDGEGQTHIRLETDDQLAGVVLNEDELAQLLRVLRA